MSTSNKLKAYVRFDGSGRVVPSSVILARFKPKVGNYQEIDAYECCNDVPVTTTTTTTQGGETPTAWIARLFSSQENACVNMFSESTIAYTASSTVELGTTLWADAALTIQFDPLGYQYIKFEGDTNIYTVFYASSTTVVNGIIAC